MTYMSFCHPLSTETLQRFNCDITKIQSPIFTIITKKEECYPIALDWGEILFLVEDLDITQDDQGVFI